MDDDTEDEEPIDVEKELKDAVAFERGTYRSAPDWRDELDGGDPR